MTALLQFIRCCEFAAIAGQVAALPPTPAMLKIVNIVQAIPVSCRPDTSKQTHIAQRIVKILSGVKHMSVQAVSALIEVAEANARSRQATRIVDKRRAAIFLTNENMFFVGDTTSAIRRRFDRAPATCSAHICSGA